MEDIISQVLQRIILEDVQIQQLKARKLEICLSNTPTGILRNGIITTYNSNDTIELIIPKINELIKIRTQQIIDEFNNKQTKLT